MTQKDKKNETPNRKCIVPGCGRTLPSDAKVPLCEWHRGEIKEGAEKVGVTVVGVAGGVVLFVKNDGPKYASKAIDAAKRFIR